MGAGTLNGVEENNRGVHTVFAWDTKIITISIIIPHK